MGCLENLRRLHIISRMKKSAKSESKKKTAFRRVDAGGHGALSRWSRDRGELPAFLPREDEHWARAFSQRFAALQREVEDFTKSEGEIFEHECGSALAESGELNGVVFDEVACNLQNRANDPEFDLAARNGRVTLVGEAKRTLRTDDVRHFAELRLPLFSKFHPDWARGRKVVGALFFKRAVASKAKRGVPPEERDPVALARSLGLMAVRATGKSGLKVVRAVGDGM